MDAYKSAIPVFLANQSTKETSAIGTAVLISLFGERFLLTAAHVTDCARGDQLLLIPGRERLISIHGTFAQLGKKDERGKIQHGLDIAYFHITPDFADRINPIYQPITEDSIDNMDRAEDANLYSIVGYPEDARTISNERCSCEFFALTGAVPERRAYRKLSYDPSLHLLVQFNVARNVMLRGDATTTPDPYCMSGGPVFSWPAGANPLERNPDPKLVAIVNTWHTDRAVFASTRIWCFMKCIEINHPDILQMVPISVDGA